MKSRIPLIKDIPLGLSLFWGAMWTDFEGHTTGMSETHDFQVAFKPYTELGFGIGGILPFQIRLDFTWQLSDYGDANRFSFGISSGF